MVAAGTRDERRLLLGADLLRLPAARPETTTGRRVGRAGHVALEHDPLPLPRQVGIAAAVAVAVIGSVLHIAASSSSSSSQSIGSPTQFPTSRDVALEVQQIIASGQAFNRHRGGNVLPM